MSGCDVTLILVSTLSSVKSVFMSISACLVSLYTVPRKLRGRESWKSRPFTITRSPTVIVPTRQQTQRVKQMPTIWIYPFICLYNNTWMGFMKATKADKGFYSLTLSPPLVISFSASGLFYLLFVPLFHACCVSFSFLSVLSFFFLLSSFQIHNFLCCAVDTHHEHKEANSG